MTEVKKCCICNVKPRYGMSLLGKFISAADKDSSRRTDKFVCVSCLHELDQQPRMILDVEGRLRTDPEDVSKEAVAKRAAAKRAALAKSKAAAKKPTTPKHATVKKGATPKKRK